MICPSCEFENAPSGKFCAECGTRLALTCPTCGSPIAAGAKFCAECGTNLRPRTGARAGGADGAVASGAASPASPGGASGAPPPGGSGAERRLVSVLFADLVGFTTLAESRDPEAVRELLTRYFDAARVVVDRYGGTIEKFIGDAVVAVWGTPVAHEDDAERAVRAALDLVDAVRSLPAPESVELRLRAGVTTGEAAVTVGAQGQGMVAGDIVNTAARLQGIAQPGTVLAGEATYRSAREAIAFEPVGEQKLKGKTEGVAVWLALRVVAQRGGAGRSAQLEPPFVGRDVEFRLLKDLLHATSREGRSRVVSIVGQAGIGKSRLAWEFLKYVDGLVEGVFWHQGRSLAYGNAISFWALGDMVRGRAGVMETDDPETTRQKLAASVDEFIPDPTDREWVLPALGVLVGVDDRGPGGREELFAAWRRYFEAIAAQGTTVLVFEDLQWADEGLLDFIESLLEWSRAQPILIVTLARPDLIDRRPDWGAGRRSFVSIALEPLTPTAMRELLDGLVPGLPAVWREAILARAEGIPLYAVETVRMLIDDGRLEAAAGGGFQPSGGSAEMGALAVPDSLHALIAARLDTLEAGDRAALQAASVLGQSFTLPALAAVAGEPVDVLEGRITGLVRREILSRDVDPRSPERGQYGFVQAAIREVAYSTLGRRDRRARHLAAARYFEGQGDDELAGVLASHYVSAYRTEPEGPEAAAILVQARLALRGAAERAASLFEYLGAARYLEQARDITPPGLDRAALEERIGDNLRMAGRLDDAEQVLRVAIAEFDAQGDGLASARASTVLGRTLIEGSRSLEAVEMLEAALARLDLERPDPTAAAIMASLARAYLGGGFFEQGLTWSDRAIGIADRADARGPLIDALISRAWAVSGMGRLRETHAILIGAIELARRYGLPQEELRALNNLNAGVEEDPDRLVAIVDEGIAVARRYGFAGWLQVFEVARIWVHLFIGEWDGLSELELELDDDDGSMGMGSQRHEARGFLAACRGDFATAEEELAHATAAMVGKSKANEIAALSAQRALLRFSQGRFAEAFEAGIASAESPETGPAGVELAARAAFWLEDPARVAQAAEAFGRTGPTVIFGEAVRAEIAGMLAALAGDRASAAASLLTAIERFREIRFVLSIANADEELGQVLGSDDPIGRAAAEEAREIYARLGAKPYLAHLESSLGRPERRAATPTTEAVPG